MIILFQQQDVITSLMYTVLALQGAKSGEWKIPGALAL